MPATGTFCQVIAVTVLPLSSVTRLAWWCWLAPRFFCLSRPRRSNHTPEQEREAVSLTAELGKAGYAAEPIVTDLLPVPQFFEVEACHQDFCRRNPTEGDFQFVVCPKLEKWRQCFTMRLKANL